MNGEIAYRHSIVSFLDILGFGTFVEDTATSANDVYNILNQAREKSNVDGQMTEMCGITGELKGSDTFFCVDIGFGLAIMFDYAKTKADRKRKYCLSRS